MKSMIEVKKVFNRGLAALAVVAAVTAVPAKAAVLCGGSVPLENYFQAWGNDVGDIRTANLVMTTNVLGYIIINNNAPNSFVLTVTARNGGFLKAGEAAVLPTLGTDGNPFTGAQFIHAQTPLTDEAEALTTNATAAVAFAAGPAGTAVLTGGAQTTALVDYMVELNATWAAAPALLAGYYTETFTIALVAVM